MKKDLLLKIQECTSLDEKQVLTYMTVFEMGEVGIGPLAEELQLHKQSLYNILEQLEEKELVTVKIKNGRKYFRAVNPEKIIQEQQKKLLQLEHIVPELQLLEGAKKYVSDIEVYSGVTAFQHFHEQQLKRMVKESSLDVIGAGGDDFLSVMKRGSFFRRYENVRIDRKVSHRLLMYADQKNVDPLYINRKYVIAKFLPLTLGQPPMATQIWPDSVALLMFGTDPQIVHIRSQKIRDGFVAYFRALWEISSS